jgi:hypothetical protein
MKSDWCLFYPISKLRLLRLKDPTPTVFSNHGIRPQLNLTSILFTRPSSPNLNKENNRHKSNRYRVLNPEFPAYVVIPYTSLAYHIFYTETEFLEVVAMSASSLCFKEAHEARLSGSIDLEEFLRHIVAHYGGLRHQTDEEGARPYIPGWSFFEDAVREIVLRDTFQPLDNDGKYFLAAR